jgi:hypothetical protein
MARTAIESQLEHHVVTKEEAKHLPQMSQSFDQLAMIEAEATANAMQMAKDLGYDGNLTVGALEDEIRFYQRRTVEAVLELGKRLLVLKELTPHGNFKQRIELLDIEYTTATRFMNATIRFSKVGSNQLLKAAKTQTKLLELLVLDDGEIEELSSGQSVRGLKLDDIETMSSSELKKALRTARETAAAKDKVISDKTAELNKKAEQLAVVEGKKRKEVTEQPMPGAEELALVQDYARGLTARIAATLNNEIAKLYQAFDNSPPAPIRLAVAQSIGLVITSAYDLAADWRVEPALDEAKAADDPNKQDTQEFLAWMEKQDNQS